MSEVRDAFLGKRQLNSYLHDREPSMRRPVVYPFQLEDQAWRPDSGESCSVGNQTGIF